MHNTGYALVDISKQRAIHHYGMEERKISAEYYKVSFLLFDMWEYPLRYLLDDVWYNHSSFMVKVLEMN